MTEHEEIRLEIVRHMRGKYRLDEVPGMYYDIPCLKFRQGKRTIVSINLHEDHYEFQIVFGKAERDQYEDVKNEFPLAFQELYDSAPTLHDGKWLFIRVDHMETLEMVKKLIAIKKEPNRKPLAKENALYGKCGHRCDMCVHYTGITDELRELMIQHLDAVYGSADWDMRCTGCDTPNCHCCGNGNELCRPLGCLREKQLSTCFDCGDYPCDQATVGYRQLEHKSISADAVTWAILPFVPYQYDMNTWQTKNKQVHHINR